MSVSITIANVPVLFITLLEEVHCNIALSFVRKWKRDGPVLFLGHYPLDNVVRTIQKLKDEGFHVLARSNHDVSEDDQPDQPPSPIQESLRSYVREGAQQIRKILKDDARISNPRLHPACADLLKIGEFKDAMCIVAESNAGTLLACAKALGIVYPRENGGEATFTRDAELLESPRSSFADLSVLGKLLQELCSPYRRRSYPKRSKKRKRQKFSGG